MLTEPRTTSLTRKRAWCPTCRGHIFYEPEDAFAMAWTSEATGAVKIFRTVECRVCFNPVRLG